MLTACAHCHRRFVVGENAIGRAARCTYCNERFLVEPHFSEELNLRGDEEELARSLNLPTLEDIEDCLQAPDVRPGSAVVERQAVSLPPLVAPPRVEYLEGQRTVATMLLLLFVGALVAYGIWSGRQAPPLAAAAAQGGIEVPLDGWSRIWEPLLSRAGLMLFVVGPCFWAGAYLAARLLRFRYCTSGFLESLAIVSVSMTFPLFTMVAFGTDDPRVVIPAAVAAFPAICLLVPALFGMPLAKGLTTAAICMGVAAPAFLLVSLWASSLQAGAIAADDARLAKLIERRRQQLAAEPATRPAEPPLVAVARSLADGISPERRLAPSPAKQFTSNVPPIPPAVELFGSAPQSAAAPTPTVAARVAELINSPAAALTPQPVATRPSAPSIPLPPVSTTPPAPSHLRIWREGGAPQQLIWPAASGSTFATVRIDQFGNHLLDFWTIDSLQRRGGLRLGGGSGVSYAVCPAGETLLRVINGASPAVELWSLADNSRRMQIPLAADQPEARALGFFDKQSFGILVRQGPEASIDVFDVKRGTVRRRISWQVLAPSGAGASECAPESVGVSPDGKIVAFVESTARVQMVDVTNGAPRKNWQLNLPRPESADVTAISFSPEGNLLAVLLDESQAAHRSALFCGPVQSMELAAISFTEPLWRQANCPRTPGKRVGRAIAWIGDHQLLAYGELILDATAGTIMASVHDRSDGTSVAAFSQYALPDGTFLLQGFPDPQGRNSALHRLRLDVMLSGQPG